MQITACRVSGDELILKTPDLQDMRRFAYNFKAGNYEIEKKAKKRSKDANNLLWAMCEEIAKAVGVEKEEVYRRNIRAVGVYEPLPIKAEAVEEFQRRWKAKGLGWFADVIDDSKIKGYKLVFAYYGSSTYTVQEMSRLIDEIRQDGLSAGVDLMSDSERALLLEEWGR